MDYLVVGMVAGLASVERKSFLQAMLARPIVICTVVGALLGDPQGGLLIGAPLELFWLGAVNLGAALPAHESLGSAAIAGGALLAGRTLGTGVTPGVALLAVLFALPLASLGRRADRLTERVNELIAARVEAAVAEGRTEAVRLNLLGMAMPFGVALALSPIGAAIAASAIPELLRRAPDASGPLAWGWGAFAALSCASGAKALRARRVPFLFAMATSVGAAIVWIAWARAM